MIMTLCLKGHAHNCFLRLAIFKKWQFFFAALNSISQIVLGETELRSRSKNQL